MKSSLNLIIILFLHSSCLSYTTDSLFKDLNYSFNINGGHIYHGTSPDFWPNVKVDDYLKKNISIHVAPKLI